MLSSELHNRTTFLPFNMETHLVSRSVDNIDICSIVYIRDICSIVDIIYNVKAGQGSHSPLVLAAHTGVQGRYYRYIVDTL